MKIEQLKSGSYRIRKMYKGITYTIVTKHKPSQKEVMQLMSKEMSKAIIDKSRMTFETAGKNYIDLKRNVISPSTVKSYVSILNNFSDEFKKKHVQDITSLDVQKEINNCSTTRTAKTVKNFHGFISVVLSTYAPNTILNTTFPKSIRKEPYIPTDDDIKTILNYAKDTVYEIPLILATFGLRRSELCALTIDDISDCKITINKATVQDEYGKWHIKQPKTDTSNRTITVPKKLTDKIKEQGYIFPYTPSALYKFLIDAQKKLNIPHFSLHKLRHYYASISHSLGIPDAYIMKSGGWKTDNVLKTVYRHALTDKQEEMEKKVAEHIKNLST